MTRFEEIRAAALRNQDMQIIRANRAKAAIMAATTPNELWSAVMTSSKPWLDLDAGRISCAAGDLCLGRDSDVSL